jgi:hypothetical protein
MYFGNGTHGDMYRQKWCFNCIHDSADPGKMCAVWSAHLVYNGDNPHQKVLDILIPEGDDSFPNCEMFIRIEKDA